MLSSRSTEAADAVLKAAKKDSSKSVRQLSYELASQFGLSGRTVYDAVCSANRSLRQMSTKMPKQFLADPPPDAGFIPMDVFEITGTAPALPTYEPRVECVNAPRVGEISALTSLDKIIINSLAIDIEQSFNLFDDDTIRDTMRKVARLLS